MDDILLILFSYKVFIQNKSHSTDNMHSIVLSPVFFWKMKFFRKHESHKDKSKYPKLGIWA